MIYIGTFESDMMTGINVRIKSRRMNRYEENEDDAYTTSGGSGMRDTQHVTRGSRGRVKSSGEEFLTRELVKSRSERKLKEETQRQAREMKKQK